MMSPFSHFCSEGARFMLVPAVIRQYSNVRPRLVSSRRSASTTSALLVPGLAPAITACIEASTASEANFNFFSSSGDFFKRWRSST